MSMYVSMFVCYATPPRCFASRALNFEGFIYDPTVGLSVLFFLIHPAITLSTNNQINVNCSYYVQLSAKLFKQLRTIVDNIMHC